MNTEPQRPEDENPDDPDMPIKKDTAADHRPDQGADGSFNSSSGESVTAKTNIAKGQNQNPDAKAPNPAQLQKQQRSPNMNTEKNKGRNG